MSQLPVITLIYDSHSPLCKLCAKNFEPHSHLATLELLDLHDPRTQSYQPLHGMLVLWNNQSYEKEKALQIIGHMAKKNRYFNHIIKSYLRSKWGSFCTFWLLRGFRHLWLTLRALITQRPSAHTPTEAYILKTLALGHIFAGLLLPTLLWWPQFHATFFSILYTQPPASANYSAMMFWLVMLGPTIASWGVIFYTLAHQYFLTPSTRLWYTMLIAILVWAPYDAALCFYHDIPLGALVDIFVTLIFLILLGYSRRHLYD